MIAIGSDHGGFDLKEEIRGYLEENGIAYKDFGCFSPESIDYADVAYQMCIRDRTSRVHAQGSGWCGPGYKARRLCGDTGTQWLREVYTGQTYQRHPGAYGGDPLCGWEGHQQGGESLGCAPERRDGVSESGQPDYRYCGGGGCRIWA